MGGLFYTPYEPDKGYDMAATSYGIDLLATYDFNKTGEFSALKGHLEYWIPC
jgi:hypothetical protein